MKNDSQNSVNTKLFVLEGTPTFLPRKAKTLGAWAEAKRLKKERATLCQVLDVEGRNWDVRQIRQTKHGFHLFYGSPVGQPWTSMPQIIPTRELLRFWDENRTRHDGFLYDLPAGRTTLKRVRHRFQFNFRQDWSGFWTDRVNDLKNMTARDFAEKHNVTLGVVFEMRRKTIGKTAREWGWWREPWMIDVLLSDLCLREIGAKLGIGTSHAKRLKDQARADYPCALRPAA